MKVERDVHVIDDRRVARYDDLLQMIATISNNIGSNFSAQRIANVVNLGILERLDPKDIERIYEDVVISPHKSGIVVLFDRSKIKPA